MPRIQGTHTTGPFILLLSLLLLLSTVTCQQQNGEVRCRSVAEGEWVFYDPRCLQFEFLVGCNANNHGKGCRFCGFGGHEACPEGIIPEGTRGLEAGAVAAASTPPPQTSTDTIARQQQPMAVNPPRATDRGTRPIQRPAAAPNTVSGTFTGRSLQNNLRTPPRPAASNPATEPTTPPTTQPPDTEGDAPPRDDTPTLVPNTPTAATAASPGLDQGQGDAHGTTPTTSNNTAMLTIVMALGGVAALVVGAVAIQQIRERKRLPFERTKRNATLLPVTSRTSLTRHQNPAEATPPSFQTAPFTDPFKAYDMARADVLRGMTAEAMPTPEQRAYTAASIPDRSWAMTVMDTRLLPARMKSSGYTVYCDTVCETVRQSTYSSTDTDTESDASMGSSRYYRS